MRKLFLFITALTLSAGLWAETINGVKYLDATGQQQTADNVTEVTNTEASATLNAGWYIVEGTNVQTRTLVCSGAVHIILADGAKLTATGVDHTPGIQVSGEGNSLAIYAQSTLASVGQLFAIGGLQCAGIGGGNGQDGSNITINGGMVTARSISSGAGIGGGSGGKGTNITINGGTVTADGGDSAAGIGGGGHSGFQQNNSGSNITINGGEVIATGKGGGAGIGGGSGPNGSGSNITINGGTVTATGSNNAASIGGGSGGKGTNITINGGIVTARSSSNAGDGIGGGESKSIFAATPILLKAGESNHEIEVPHFTGCDIAAMLKGKTSVIVVAGTATPYAAGKNDGIVEGKAAAKAELLGDMAEPCTGCTAVEVTDGTTTVTLYNATGVDYIKVPSEE